MPTGEPVLGSGLGDGQLLGDDLENSNAGTGHALRLSARPRTPQRRSPVNLNPSPARCDLCPDS
jgi:hypothetical protein